MTATIAIGNIGQTSNCANPPIPTLTITDNVAAPDTISLGNCILFNFFMVSGVVTVPDGYIITSAPAAFPSTVGLISGQGTVIVISPYGMTATYAITNGALQATGTPPPTITPSPTAWTPSAPLGSTTSISQNVTFSGMAPVSFGTSVTTTDGGSWLSVALANLNSSSSVTITVNPTGLTKPTYNGTVILNYGPDYPTTQIPVTLTMTPSQISVISVSPNKGTGLTQTFTAVYSDPSGALDLSDVLILFNTTFKTANACGIDYRPGTNKLHLYNDGGTGGVSGGLIPGSSGSLSNSQCTIEAAGSSVNISGNTLTLAVSVKFNDIFFGQKNVYLEAVGGGLATGYVKKGSWIPLSLGPPSVISLTPTTGAGVAQTFSSTYSVPNGLSDLIDTTLLINITANAANACGVIYVLETKRMYLYNDAGTGYSPVTPGTSETASNSQCTLEGAGSSVGISGNDITVNVALTFSNTFVGKKNVYLHPLGRTQSGTWVLAGTWTP